jgi:hypothetical protein
MVPGGVAKSAPAQGERMGQEAPSKIHLTRNLLDPQFKRELLNRQLRPHDFYARKMQE